MTVELLTILAAVIVFGLFLSVWLITFVANDASLYDLVWGATFGLVAAAMLASIPEPTTYHKVLAALPIIWAIRYTAYLWYRNLGKGEDDRYTVYRKKIAAEGKSWIVASFVMLMGFQSVSAFIVCAPLIVGFAAPPTVGLGPVAYAGILLWLAGFLVEAVADLQLTRFKTANRDYDGPYESKPLLDTGLWKYSRHPNYFGNACIWWGIALVALEARHGWIGLIGAAYMNFALVFATGKANNERKMRERTAYADYVARTSGFIPLPPKRKAN